MGREYRLVLICFLNEAAPSLRSNIPLTALIVTLGTYDFTNSILAFSSAREDSCHQLEGKVSSEQLNRPIDAASSVLQIWSQGLKFGYPISFFGRKNLQFSVPVSSIYLDAEQVGNPTLTTSQLKTRDSKDSARA
jgi:hypothetical protein